VTLVTVNTSAEWFPIWREREMARLVQGQPLSIGEKVRRKGRWTSAGETPAGELVRSTR